MYPFFRVRFAGFLLLVLLAGNVVYSQNQKATLAGFVKDSTGALLQGARITLEPAVQPQVSNAQGAFVFSNLEPGKYKVTVSYVGFTSYTSDVDLTAGQNAQINAVLSVASANDQVLVVADRPLGEAEALNRTLAAENILQVLPAEVITSLPNANIADALGRMPSVTIERDEGEGKYVQIRGTEPRLSNTMVDGVTVPSPESGVRQIKLDTIASDLVESVEINKTLQANIDADGIGGSVNLVTKTASDTPTVALYGLGGYTPIMGGRTVNQAGGTVGKRFGATHKFGALMGGTYDFNGRGINDIEPDPQPNPDGTLSPYYDTMDLRDYVYNRTRWGLTGSADYKLNDGSDISVRGLFSTFRNWGNKWSYTLNDHDNPQYSQDWRRPNMAVGSLSVQGKHTINANTFQWNFAVGRSRSLSGSGSAKYKWIGDDLSDSCYNDQSVAASVYRPGWSAGCFGSGTANSEDRDNYKLKSWAPPTFGQSVQLNLQASGDYARIYHIGTHYGTLELGGKIRNAHKFDDTYDETFTPKTTMNVVDHPEWYSNFKDPDYYDKTYHIGTVTDYSKVRAYVDANQTQFNMSGGPGVNVNNYDLIERIPAGYLMNTIELHNRVRLVAGVRFEATHVSTLSFDQNAPTPPTTLTVKAGGDYLDVLPSASLRFAIDKDSDLRLVYGRGLARPDPQDITAAASQIDISTTPATVGIGNPNLKAEHANNYDLLYERFLSHVGLIQAGYFYKQLSDPIVTLQTLTKNYPGNPGAYTLVSQPSNAGSAHVQGIELAYQQRLSYLPSVLGGLGLSANYSYTTSKAEDVDPLRTDSPALLRQAPNAWNISPTYDTKKFSMRVGMTYDDRMIYAYQYEDLQYVTDDNGNPVIVDGKQETAPNPQPGGTKGPHGDNYLYPHYQFDTQASYRMPWGFEVYGYGLNLNNEVFGFYYGSGQYVVQREYYHPSFAGGVRWNLVHER
ncbi:TonB-dependent receptor [Occallatibacter riparius]|uniref:TonB-dependent receptor n=1 Tax=Occallatibacter riparius TaxID=1002689 RepID=A0A9J7BV94_9BACT|nr:TonB-dependent receptor [Occallatibacter riparius]UWZ85698.1 TonB-dependent receptor [Occallatibacter riparius]